MFQEVNIDEALHMNMATALVDLRQGELVSCVDMGGARGYGLVPAALPESLVRRAIELVGRRAALDEEVDAWRRTR